MTPVFRTFFLLALLGAGAGAGWVGQVITGSEVWYLAVPISVSAGWLAVADPAKCQTSLRAPGRSGRAGLDTDRHRRPGAQDRCAR